MRRLKSVFPFLILTLSFSALNLACSKPAKSEVAAQRDNLVSLTVHVDGMVCGGCEANVRSSLKKMDGIFEVEASHKEKRVTVKVDGSKMTMQTLKKAINDLGYKAKTS